MTEEEKNERKEKAFKIVNKIKLTKNIFMPENAELKGKFIAELERIIKIDTQEKVKKASNCPILFVGNVYKAMLAGCYAHCVRKVKFVANLLPKRLEETWIKYGGDINEFEEIKSLKQPCEMLSEAEGGFIYKDCFGQPIEKIWYADDPAYCHTSLLYPNWYAYTQHTGIKNWLELYILGATLFLVGLEGEDSNECKEFVKNIRDPKPAFPNKLIVHTNDINKLPKYFPDHFEIIELEPGEQDAAKQDNFIPFPTPSRTQWHEVKISFIDDDNVKIRARDVTEKRHYSEMGFKDNKSKRNESIFLWKFLKELASLSGKYTNCPDKEKDKLKKYFSDLRKALFQLFKIDGDPIPYKKTKDYTGYETAFIIEDKSFSKEHEDSIRKHYREYVPSKHKYICKDEDEGDEFTDNNYSLND